jgi:MFS family permease
MITFFGILIRALATHPNHLLLAAFVGGFAGADFFPVLVTMITDIASPREQREAMSTLYLFSGIGMLIGPLIGSILLLVPRISLRNLYQIQVVAEMLSILYMVRTVSETRPENPQAERSNSRTDVADLLAKNGYRRLLIMGFLFYFDFSILNTYLPIYGRLTLNLTDAEASSLSLYRNIAVMMMRLSAATFLSRVRALPLLVFALASGGLSSLLAAFAGSYIMISLVELASGMAHGVVAILGASLVAVESKPGNRDVAQSIYNMAQGMSNVARLATTSIVGGLGLTSVFLMGGIAALTSAATILPREKDRHQLAFIRERIRSALPSRRS